MLKLISVNIQGDMQKGTVVPFFTKEKDNFDVVCLQELFEEDIKMFEELLGMKAYFMPMMYKDSFKRPGEDYKLFGPAIFTKHEIEFHFKYIVGDENNIPEFAKAEDSYKERNTTNVVLIWGDIKFTDGLVYRIATTHFTWTPDGSTTLYQLEDMSKLVEVLENDVRNFVLVGDLNAPRGKEAFGMLVEKFKDNIPEEYDSSLDPVLHRVPTLRYVVDGLFSTPEYLLSDVKLIEGVSDHKAVIADIQKV